MIVQNILVFKESREEETRVALTPADVSLFSSRFHVYVEMGAGVKAGFQDAEYTRTGAKIIDLASMAIPQNTIVLRVKLPSQEREAFEAGKWHNSVVVMGFLDPLAPLASPRIAAWQRAVFAAYSMDLFKSIPIEDNKNMQAAMSRIAGKLAFRDAQKQYIGPHAPKLVVIGSGPAGKSAAMEACRAGVPVEIFGRSDRYSEWKYIEGVAYHQYPSKNYIEHLRPFLNQATMVVVAARVAGEHAHMLIDEESLKGMKRGAVIVDLTVNEGGSVAFAKSDQVVDHNGVKIVHVSGYPKQLPQQASMAYSQCMGNLLNELISKEGKLIYDHPLLNESWVTYKGSRNPHL